MTYTEQWLDLVLQNEIKTPQVRYLESLIGNNNERYLLLVGIARTLGANAGLPGALLLEVPLLKKGPTSLLDVKRGLLLKTITELTSVLKRLDPGTLFP